MRRSAKPNQGRAVSSGSVVGDRGHRTPRGGARGFSLIEVLVGLLITVIAVVGLTGLFGSGRALIDHYEVARAATWVAQQRLELLGGVGTSSDLSIGTHPSTANAFVYRTVAIGTESWTVAWYDDPIDGTGAGDANPNDLKRVTVKVQWGQGVEADSVKLVRIFPSSP